MNTVIDDMVEELADEMNKGHIVYVQPEILQVNKNLRIVKNKLISVPRF